MKLNAFFAVLISLLIAGCGLSAPDQKYPAAQEGEVYVNGGVNRYKLILPEGFTDIENFMNVYPLVIALHGKGSTGYYEVKQVIEGSPCVYFAPNNGSTSFGGSGGAWIREALHSILENPNYKIDKNRIYIIGFSMGGWGATMMPQDLYTDYGYLTAAIVPVEGGWFSYNKSVEVLDHLSCWFHFGNGSGSAYDAGEYQDAKKAYPHTVETRYDETISYSYDWAPSTVYSWDTTQNILLQGRNEIVRQTVYDGMGHSASPVFMQGEVIEWLFAQNTRNRDN